ncbi:unnamed protein product, partial [Rhizoctonia solani]
MLSSDNLTGWGNYTAVLGYGEKWKFHRKLMHETLQKSASEERWPMIQKESRLALQRILAHPREFSQGLRHMTGSTLLMAVYGYEVTSPDDNLFKTVKIASDGFIQAAVAPINTFPWLEYVPQWFPRTSWKAKANLWRTQKDRMLHVPYNWTKNKMWTGTEVPSMVSTWLRKYVRQQSTAPVADLEERIKWIAGGLFAAGSDTSVSVLRTFIIAMAMHPDVQAKAQAEIDSIIGLCLPELSDQESLPYVQCIIKELAFRAISNDSEVYPEPDRFNPDRFLDPSVPEAPVFGFGHRICPGLHHAEAVVTIATLGLLAMFNIHPEEDVNGNSVPLKADTTVNEVLRQVLPFKCKISPRSEKHEQM